MTTFDTLVWAVQIPDPDPIPLAAPQWLLWFLMMLTFLFHLLAMNTVLGGAILGAVYGLLSRGKSETRAARLSRWIFKYLPVGVAAAVTFGVAPLLFVQVLYGRLLYSSSILIGWYWLAVIPILILAYYGAYLLAFKAGRLGGRTRLVAWPVALGFVVIAFIYVNNMSLMLRPDRFLALYSTDSRGFNLNLDDPTFLPRFLHFVLASLAVAGLAVALLGWLRLSREGEFGRWAVRQGAVWFTAATAVNVVAGLWFLLSLPRTVMLQFMGGSLVATLALWVGVFAGLAALSLMVLVTQARHPAPILGAATGALLLALVGMIVTRDQVRRAVLDGFGYAITQAVAPQWGVILLFAILLVAALGTVVWMAATLYRSSVSQT